MTRTKKKPIHPGKHLLAELEDRGLTQAELANSAGITRAYVSDICSGKRGISLKLALRLEKALGVDAALWMELQNRYDLAEARKR